MKPILAAFLMASIGVSVPVYASECNDNFQLSTKRPDGTRVGICISAEEILSTQKWNPLDGEPPISIPDAVDMALKFAQDKYIRFDSVEISGIDLQPYGSSAVVDRWYYIFDITLVIEGGRVRGGGNWVAVLMDGTVIGTQEGE